MSTTWIETVVSVALGAMIGSVPAAWAIRAENRRFEASGIAEFEADEAEQLRRCLVPMAQCVENWAYVAEEWFMETGETPEVRVRRLSEMNQRANDDLESRIGEIVTNPRAEIFQDYYLEIQKTWNQFVLLRVQRKWTDGSDATYQELVASMKFAADDFSKKARNAISALNAPASLKRRSVQPKWQKFG